MAIQPYFTVMNPTIFNTTDPTSYTGIMTIFTSHPDTVKTYLGQCRIADKIVVAKGSGRVEVGVKGGNDALKVHEFLIHCDAKTVFGELAISEAEQGLGLRGEAKNLYRKSKSETRKIPWLCQDENQEPEVKRDVVNIPQPFTLIGLSPRTIEFLVEMNFI